MSSIESLPESQDDFLKEVNNLHELVENEQKSWEYITINELTDKEKESLEKRKESKRIEIQRLIDNITNNKLQDELREESISGLLSYIWSNAKVEYSSKNKEITTGRIKEFFNSVKEWKISLDNMDISITMDDANIHRIQLPTWEYINEQKIFRIKFSTKES